MNGYVVVICVMLIMFAGLAIVIAQADADERRFLSEHDSEDDSDLMEPSAESAEQGRLDTNAQEVESPLVKPENAAIDEPGEDALNASTGKIHPG